MQMQAATAPGGMATPPGAYPHLQALIARAKQQAAARSTIGLVYPCDALAIDAAAAIVASGIAMPLLIGPRALIEPLAQERGLDLAAIEIVNTPDAPAAAAARATELARTGRVQALMKGSLHTDELMSAVVRKEAGLRTARRISHAFIFDLPRYHKPLALADCVVNITPDLKTKGDILSNAIDLLCKLGLAQPKVGILAAVETVNPAIQATVDAGALVARHREEGAWPQAIVEGPFGFDNVISAEAARVKKLQSQVSGDADLLLVPDLNAGNMLYKSFNYIGGGDCAGLILGAGVPVVLTSRADSLLARTASAALAVLVGRPAH